MSAIPTVKIVLVGCSGVGKTSYLRSLAGYGFEPKWVASIGCTIHPVEFNTNMGPIVVRLWDTAGNETLAGYRDSHYTGSHGCIAMFDSSYTQKAAEMALYDVYKASPGVKVAYASTKCDRVTRRKSGDDLFEISSKTREGVIEPIQYLLRQILHREITII